MVVVNFLFSLPAPSIVELCLVWCQAMLSIWLTDEGRFLARIPVKPNVI